MGELGNTLRHQRLERKLSLTDAADTLKIPTRYLSALEQEQWDVLPGGVFTRSYLRNYAGLLGLDGTALVERYVAATGDRSQPSGLPVVVEAESSVSAAGALLLSALVLAIAGLCIWAGVHIYGQHRRRALEVNGAAATVMTPAKSGAATSVSAAPATSVPAPMQAPARPASDGGPAPSRTTRSASVPPPSPAVPTTAAKPEKTPAGTALTAAGTPSAAAGPAAPAITSAGSLHTLVVAATTQPVWLSVHADGKMVLEDTLLPGQSRSWQGNHFEILTGNAGATGVTIDGKSTPLAGKIGQVTHIEWPRSDSH